MPELYRRPPTKLLPPVPPEFVQVFLTKGWQGVERMYGRRTSVHVAWAHLAGLSTDLSREARSKFRRERRANGRAW